MNTRNRGQRLTDGHKQTDREIYNSHRHIKASNINSSFCFRWFWLICRWISLYTLTLKVTSLSEVAVRADFGNRRAFSNLSYWFNVKNCKNPYKTQKKYIKIIYQAFALVQLLEMLLIKICVYTVGQNSSGCVCMFFVYYEPIHKKTK